MAVVPAFGSVVAPESSLCPISVLEALRGDFDFTALPADDWLDRDRRPNPRDLGWED